MRDSFAPAAGLARRSAAYALAVGLPLVAIGLGAGFALPAFVFEHLIVLLVVGFAIGGGLGPAIVVAITGTLGDNLLLREPFGRPSITGVRDAIDFGLFVIVALMVAWVVNRVQIARERAARAADRERVAREERDRLIATVIHDLATPLAAIQGTIRFAQQNAATSTLDLPRLLARVETAAARATALIRTLAEVRSLDEDGMALNLKSADVCDVAEATVRMLDRFSDRHPILLTRPSGPVMLECDAERLGRVLENLVTNAIKYSPDGGPVEVHVEADDASATVRVCDSGIGIPEADRERLCELGFRSEAAASVAPGLGFGLYVAARIVHRHGGSLTAAARDGGGTVFTVRLPKPATDGRTARANAALDVASSQHRAS